MLAALCVFGLLQTRTRRVAMWLALLLPAAMLILSLSGILQYVGLWLPALAAWVLGIGAASLSVAGFPCWRSWGFLLSAMPWAWPAPWNSTSPKTGTYSSP